MAARLKPFGGKRVTAETYPSDEYDRGPEPVEGVLVLNWVEALGYTQAVVGGVVVDPATVRAAE